MATQDSLSFPLAPSVSLGNSALRTVEVPTSLSPAPGGQNRASIPSPSERCYHQSSLANYPLWPVGQDYVVGDLELWDMLEHLLGQLPVKLMALML